MARGKVGLEPAMKRFIHQHLRGRKPKRLHMSNRKSLSFGTFKNREQRTDHKPTGLWYGVGDSWIQWCMSEVSGWICPYIYEVVLEEDKLLLIDNEADFEKFEDEHHDIPEWKKEMRRMEQAKAKELGFTLPDLENDLDFMMPRGMGRMRFHDSMNYGKVAEKYGAIEIAPYLWTKRLESMWYYGWDCASGCVWHKSALKSLRLFAFYDEAKGEFVRTSLQPDKIKV